MAKLEILHFPDKRLRTKAREINTVDEALRLFIDDMFETMYEAPGIGLAATQVNFHKRLMVIDVSEEKDEPLCFINPVITHKEGVEVMQEGCLSVPGFYEDVERAENITVTALDKHGEPFELTTGDLLAVCIQHEIDHLDGKLFVDYLSPLKRNRIRKKLERMEKELAAQNANPASTL
ncbi:MAG: peptide deformylase [Cycloclasticus sp. symbiont of Bathymodiolus heckerae]|nr:MAG: peptide deformylase [Cycloclasticus sp. symbiont of Bathymodiolus heckerae]